MKLLRFYVKEVDIGFLNVLIKNRESKTSEFMRKMMKKWKNFLDWHHFNKYYS
jgi:hypothetical protein